MDIKKAIAKLASILSKQNLALTKIAQVTNEQEIKEYLNRVITTAVANSGVQSQYHINLHKAPGETLGDGISSDESYVLTATFNPPIADNNQRQKLMNNFYSTLKSRPDLDGKVSFIFN